MDEFDDIIAGRDAAPEPLTDAYRVIRPLARAEHPVPAVLAHGPDGPVALADACDLDGWPGWDLHGQHVLSPVDVARTASGHAVVLPWCRHRLTAEWAARDFSGGQAVTLAVSLMRGCLEARRGERGAAEGPAGAWWADDDGRPVFAPAVPDGDEPSAAGHRGKHGGRHALGAPPEGDAEPAGAAALLAIVADAMLDRVVRRLLDRAVDLLADPAELVRAADGFESELFEACAPQPLDFAVPDDAEQEPTPLQTRALRRFAPRTRRGTGRGAAPATGSPDVAPRGGRRAAGGAGHSPRGDSQRHVTGRGGPAGVRWGGITASVGHTTRSAAARLRSGLRGRRAAYAAGGAAAAAVLLAGVLWPTDETVAKSDGPTSVETREAAPGEKSGGTGTTAKKGAEKPGDPEDTSSEQPDGGEDGGADAAREAPVEQDASSAAEEGGAPTDAGSGAEDDIQAEVSADPVEAAARLVGRAAECGDACGDVFAEGAAARPDAAPWTELDGDPVSLIDDYGGVTLVKAGEGGDAHYLSLVLTDGRWLLRDAYPAG